MPPGNRLTEHIKFLQRDAPGETSLHGILKMWVRISYSIQQMKPNRMWGKLRVFGS
ncbi:MAG: hypothetical protein JETT_1001 [Candidatus Jettenia ecosi]|uniref:Uncharacterized protein n=1 Tax=Candidatus Jettenia ecosi TaxID=2494326 RepID=A0A533QD65_9BACT|nr:MAG: hypothetical protein JETT_1001 [Candidatus Jettenia ecosi]